MKIATAISGGVDSIRAACLLQEEGHEVFGIHMRFLPSSGKGGEFAAMVAEREQLLLELAAKCGITTTIVDLREKFDSTVIMPFIEAYRQGLTPNPCIDCNPKVKFGFLLDEALKLGADKLATGHYVRLSSPASGAGRFQLKRGRDSAKDQSYFLMGLSQEQLSRAVFPLGGYTKDETRAWAKQTGLGALISEDSQEICFIPSGAYSDFVRSRVATTAEEVDGPILDLAGNYLGAHKGIYSYTVGQRRGLGIPSTEPYYVVRIEPEENMVRVGRSKDLFCSALTVSGVNWVSIEPPDEPVACQVRIRNLHRPAPAEVTPAEDSTARIRFFEPQRAVTPGQAAVFYSDDLLLGGGIITRPASS
ncbi:MAG: tRNA 2-thiouridine(34) synthase MnmA [Syntrophobacteraceae bacterium]